MTTARPAAQLEEPFVELVIAEDIDHVRASHRAPRRHQSPHGVAYEETARPSSAGRRSRGSLVEDGSCPFPGAFAGDPKLTGPTGSPQYFALGDGSAAIDAGQNPTCARLDQRGAQRPADGNKDGYRICDLGSFEKGGRACGLIGVEGLALLPFVGWLRRAARGRRGSPTQGTPCAEGAAAHCAAAASTGTSFAITPTFRSQRGASPFPRSVSATTSASAS